MRITGGVHRSRPLRAPRGDRTRPTSDRVREALFAILGAQRSLEGARVLDLYAGTGALGLEALSRGAAHATLVESARSALEAIAANVEALRVRAQVRVVALPVERATTALRLHGPFDLVLADPPYAQVADGAAGRALGALAEAGLFAADATVVLEHASGDHPPVVSGLSLQESRRYGDTTLTLYVAASQARG
jgi:16S rRNA (guanine(966)-N(2))-methyltransferase RsmD